MIISVTTLSWLISGALLITVLAPIVLLIFWIKDWLKDQLW